MAPLSWIFELKDQMSGPAKQIVINLNAVVKATDGVKKAAKETSSSIKDVFAGISLERVAEKALELGKSFVEAVVDMNRFATQTKIAFEVMTGSSYLAKETFEEAKRVAFQLGAPVEQVAASYKEMLSAGEQVENLQALAKAASDLSHFEGGSIESWTKAFSDIRGKGELAGRSLAAFVGAVDLDVLAKKLGLTTHGYKELTKALTVSPVSAQRGIQAILQTLAESQGGKLEIISKRMADTFSGTIASIKGEVMDLFEIDSTDSPILEFLHGVRDALRPGSPLVMEIRAGVTSFMEGLGVISEGGGLKELVASLKDGSILGERFKETMFNLGTALRYAAKSIDLVASGLAKLGLLLDAQAEYFEGLKKISPTLLLGATGYVASRKEEVPTAAGAETAGMRGTMRSVLPPAGRSLREELAGAIQAPALSGDGGVLSPAIPGHADGGIVIRPHVAMVGEEGPEAIIPLDRSGGLGARINLNLEQHFHVHGGGEAPVRELAGDLHAMGLGDFQGALDTLAQLAGAI